MTFSGALPVVPGRILALLNLLDPSNPLVRLNWRNWWLEVTVGVSDVRLYWIEDNSDDGGLVLIDKRGFGSPPDGVYDCAARFFLAFPGLERVVEPRQQYFKSGLRLGSRWAEEASASSPDTPLPWLGASAELIEMTDDLENPRPDIFP